jgi:hypothetical protein
MTEQVTVMPTDRAVLALPHGKVAPIQGQLDSRTATIPRPTR